MENKKELFDLKREKQELDAFLSTFVQADVSYAAPGIRQPEQSFAAEEQTATELPSGSEPETSEMKMEESPGLAAIKSMMGSSHQESTGRESGISSLKEEEASVEREMKSGLDLEIPPLEMASSPESVAQKSELEIPLVLEMEERREQPAEEEKMPSDEEGEGRLDLTETVVLRTPEADMREPETARVYEEEKAPLDLGDTVPTQTGEGFEESLRTEEAVLAEESATRGAVGPAEDFETISSAGEARQADTPVEIEKEPEPEEEKPIKKPEPGKKPKKTGAYDFAPEKTGSGFGKWILIGLLIILLAALLIGVFVFLPDTGGNMMKTIKSYIPLSRTDQSAVSPTVSGIRLSQIKQKIIFNENMKKSIRVLEGIAENLTSRPVSKIKITANLYDAKGTLLGQAESFGGNIIIDDRLESLDAKGIGAALKDATTLGDRLQPKGQLPFMIVLINQPARIFRMTVMPVDFKKH